MLFSFYRRIEEEERKAAEEAARKAAEEERLRKLAEEEGEEGAGQLPPPRSVLIHPYLFIHFLTYIMCIVKYPGIQIYSIQTFRF